eukprot:jgi/Chrzof1/11170/Cz05g26150.t1
MAPTGWLAAGAGFLFSYYNSKVQEERKARIERVCTQLKDFYGPLLACVTATKSSYDAMVQQHSPDGTILGFQRAVMMNPHGAEGRAYRLWMTEVLQPLNERAATIIFDHIDLLESSTIIPELLQLVAHMATSRVMLQRWKDGEFDTKSVISYPDKLLGFIQDEFDRVKRKQADLLGEKTVLSKL